MGDLKKKKKSHSEIARPSFHLKYFHNYFLFKKNPFKKQNLLSPADGLPSDMIYWCKVFQPSNIRQLLCVALKNATSLD